MVDMTTTTNSHAIVIGAGMGGLLAARAASEFFDRVTVVERDTLPNTPTVRRCVPQARHAHALTTRGRTAMEELFPGFTDDLLGFGAPHGDMQADFRWVLDGHRLARGVSGVRLLLVSRPLIEWHLRNLVHALPNVEIIDRCAAIGVTTDQCRVVTGLAVSRKANRIADDVIDADLIVDASGRSSKSQGWLEPLGFPRPREESLRIHLAYATRHYRREPSHLDSDLGIGVGPTPELPRSGMMLAQENDRWVITLAGYGDDEPPLDSEGFVEFAATLPAPELGDWLSRAEPLDEGVRYRVPTTVRRHFDSTQLPDGYIPFGDTICCFNPIYGQGMSVAALEAIILRQCLHGDRRRVTGRFLRRARPILDEAWDMACNSDLRLPSIEGERTVKTRVTNAYVARVHRAAATDPKVGAAFGRVINLLAHPASLMSPPTLARVLWANRRDAPKDLAISARNFSSTTATPSSPEPGLGMRGARSLSARAGRTG
ncbi:FAD-dependent oxidoreductase [Rhodococcus tukisamuensis]|uniref:2-polyprenyl-6-methoxyphenol hydroxylase n=1 Tax=Rhodococcus tukisamuensis TaxID=168276 RepID=A0A1G6UJA9_9NOCA|nr:monooxygenase [Rhodococcus tukisamuensis]SDD41349.1 2-polyprenyl-6-methoxyphenol hydroxylase [Rhodococcus tukisamuensis]